MIDDKTRTILLRYLQETRTLPNESAKTHHFVGLVSQLFPGTTAPIEVASGIEKLVRIQTDAGIKRGRIDLYHGNAVIEFENSLKATGDEAERQLVEYTAGLWSKEGKKPRPLLCVASDGIVWRTYRPRLKPGVSERPKPSDVDLEHLRTIVLTRDTVSDFWIWLTSLLFRQQRTEPSVERFRVDFGATSPAFADAMDALRTAWSPLRKLSETRLAFMTWKKYLTYTYGRFGSSSASDSETDENKGEIETLFLKHTYLACVARFLVWAALSAGRTNVSLRELARSILTGNYFESQKIENLVERDFFQWVNSLKVEPMLAPVWERMLGQILTYDVSRIDQDVLKGVYQELVDPKDRHELGEYYTPEWLCEVIVSRLLPETGICSVLDPACGSGSFLRAAIAHILAANDGRGAADSLRAVLDHVVGIDIHPLAVTISRATYLIAIRDLVKKSSRPVHIPVYLADSLFLPTEVTKPQFGQTLGSYEIRFGGDRRVQVPADLIRRPDLFDPAIAACTVIAVEHSTSRTESQGSLRAYLEKTVPQMFDRKDAPEMVAALWRFAEELSELISRKYNSIWAFIVRNGYRPAMLRERFDFIVGNPPWLSYRYIADPEYQSEVKKRAVDEYKIAPKSQKLMTQMELATVFLAHSIATFARDGGRLAFVMPRAILSADQHANLRLRSYSAPLKIDECWDLMEVEPIFKVPCSVVFAEKAWVHTGPNYSLPFTEWSGHLPGRDVSWSLVKSHLEKTDKTGRVIYLGERNALSTGRGKTSPTPSSDYKGRFRQGATIVPRNFYFIRGVEADGHIDPAGLTVAETDPEQGEQAKAPYVGVNLRGRIEGRFIFCTALSRHLLPFTLLDPALVALPIELDHVRPKILTAEQLRKGGYREFARWMKEVEKIWAAERGGKAKSLSVYGWLDYQGKLTGQTLATRHLVLYNASGTNVCATHVDRSALRLPFVADHKTYWVGLDTRQEADFLVAFLNSDTVNDLIKPFQSVGLQGERDIHKKVLDIQIPDFDKGNRAHNALVSLGEKGALEAQAFVAKTSLPKSLARRRADVREALQATFAEIDGIVSELLDL